MKKLSKFETAFASARKSGLKEFSFGGKKFNTKLKESGKVVNLPSKGPVPTAKPDRTLTKPLVQPARSRFSPDTKMSEEAKTPANRPVQKKKISFKGNVQGMPAASKADRLGSKKQDRLK